MALIKSQLVLTDGMSAPLRSINKAMNMVLNSFESVQRTSSRAIDTASIQEAREELARTSRALDELDSKTNQAGNSADSLMSKFMRAGAAIGAALSVRNIIGLADEMTQMDARLNIITGDLEKTKALQDKIMESANRSRATYTDTANMVAKLGTNAKDAFSNTDELVSFAEAVNKTFTISGASAVEQKNATLQLVQAMSSGVLRGDELRSIFEQAPILVQTIADYLDVPIGKIRDMAAEGKITADVVKVAMLSNADIIDEQFNKMPYTFSQVANTVKNILMQAFLPAIQVIGSGAQWIQDNWSNIEPVLAGVAVAVGILTVAWLAWTAAKWLDIEANYKMITSLLANPVFHFAIIVGLLIGLFFKWAQSVGGVENAWELCKMALVVGINYVKLAFYSGVYGILNFLDLLKLSWKATGVAVADFAGDMKVSVLTILQNMVNGAIDIINDFIGTLNKIPGVSIDAIEHVTFATTARAENNARKSARAEEFAAYRNDLDAAKASRDAKIDTLSKNVDSSTNALTAAYRQMKADAAADSSAELSAYDSMGAELAEINESAGSAASSLNSTAEDLKYMRDLAEQEVINRFTTAEVKIDMSGMTNRIDSNMDLDGVLSALTGGFAEALEIAAEGVHE